MATDHKTDQQQRSRLPMCTQNGNIGSSDAEAEKKDVIARVKAKSAAMSMVVVNRQDNPIPTRDRRCLPDTRKANEPHPRNWDHYHQGHQESQQALEAPSKEPCENHPKPTPEDKTTNGSGPYWSA